MANVPTDLKYTKTHEWVRLEGDVATIGITDNAQTDLGDIVYVELPNVGFVAASEVTLGSIESVKAVADIYAPIAGTVTEVNPALAAQSDLVNSDPYGRGYLLKIKVSDPSVVDSLLSAEEYSALAH